MKFSAIVTSNHTAYFVKSLPDYSILSSYFNAQSYAVNRQLVTKEFDRLGDKGILTFAGGMSSPLYSLLSMYTGIERIVYDLLDAPQVVEDAMESMKQAACRWYEAAVHSPCEAIRCTEDLDTKTISPELFRKYAIPALKEYARICHEGGKLFVIHMCGHIKDFLQDIRDIGADAIHCLSTPPIGNTPVREARRVLSPRTAAMIRIDANALMSGDNRRIDACIRSIREDIGDWRNALVIIPCGRASLWSIRRAIEQTHRIGGWK